MLIWIGANVSTPIFVLGITIVEYWRHCGNTIVELHDNGQFNSPCVILTLAHRKTPTLPVKMSIICPSFHSQRFTESFTRQTNSPFRFFTSSLDHFDLWFHCGRLSQSIFSRSFRHMLEQFWKTFSDHESVHWMAWIVHSRSFVLAD